MDLWTDLIAPLVGTVISVSTIFFPFIIVVDGSQWDSTSSRMITSQVR